MLFVFIIWWSRGVRLRVGMFLSGIIWVINLLFTFGRELLVIIFGDVFILVE